ncbi:hypothetical protein Avi_9605 (plasmid) [Allorhizobium ampelinum S4]|uniref:Uncharacterized protein n=1 Tax=Allorhizobium ampelinum (strain ATCC BAA-846 / DSM 112012 / S4) TaxID=311402 RepID=B9K377_ALLAM|nr:hypothetical protein Avi_9605 [Allorhizobium ampelinum S4]
MAQILERDDIDSFRLQDLTVGQQAARLHLVHRTASRDLPLIQGSASAMIPGAIQSSSNYLWQLCHLVGCQDEPAFDQSGHRILFILGNGSSPIENFEGVSA